MSGELFTEGEFLLAALAFVDGGNALGGGWRWGAEDVFEEEFAAFDGGGAGGRGGDGEDAAVGEDAAAGSALERDFLQFVAFDAGEVVVFSEAFVGEGVVGVEEVEDGEVFFDEVGEEGFGFAPEVRLDFVEVFEAGVVGVEVFEVAKLEPLAGEVFGEGFGAPVGEHAIDGGGEAGAEFGFGGELEEFFVWRSGPEEVGEAGGEGELVDELATVEVGSDGVGGGMVEEARGDEEAFEEETESAEGAFAVREGGCGELRPALGFFWRERASEEAGGHAGGEGGDGGGIERGMVEGAFDADLMEPEVAVLLGGFVVEVVEEREFEGGVGGWCVEFVVEPLGLLVFGGDVEGGEGLAVPLGVKFGRIGAGLLGTGFDAEAVAAGGGDFEGVTGGA